MLSGFVCWLDLSPQILRCHKQYARKTAQQLFVTMVKLELALVASLFGTMALNLASCKPIAEVDYIKRQSI
jgi:hypothetical protein